MAAVEYHHVPIVVFVILLPFVCCWSSEQPPVTALNLPEDSSVLFALHAQLVVLEELSNDEPSAFNRGSNSTASFPWNNTSSGMVTAASYNDTGYTVPTYPEYKLFMLGIDQFTTWFTDRPDRVAGSVNSSQFLLDFQQLFGKVAPNAVILGREDGAVVIEMCCPESSTLDGEFAVEFRARIIPPSTKIQKHYATALVDVSDGMEIQGASIFIDNALTCDTSSGAGQVAWDTLGNVIQQVADLAGLGMVGGVVAVLWPGFESLVSNPSADTQAIATCQWDAILNYVTLEVENTITTITLSTLQDDIRGLQQQLKQYYLTDEPTDKFQIILSTLQQYKPSFLAPLHWTNDPEAYLSYLYSWSAMHIAWDLEQFCNFTTKAGYSLNQAAAFALILRDDLKDYINGDDIGGGITSMAGDAAVHQAQDITYTEDDDNFKVYVSDASGGVIGICYFYDDYGRCAPSYDDPSIQCQSEDACKSQENSVLNSYYQTTYNNYYSKMTANGQLSGFQSMYNAIIAYSAESDEDFLENAATLRAAASDVCNARYC